MTAKEAKQNLPKILAKWNGKIYTATTSGRANQFASIALSAVEEDGRIRPIMGPIFHATWEAVAHCAESGKPMICD